MKGSNWKKFGLEFLSIFIAVILAFALNNWNENRRDSNAESKIITEIYNGLKEDLGDILVNKGGHKEGIQACNFWRNIIQDNEVNLDSLSQHYFNLTRDFISVQNVSGYETLKSRGLELVKNDSLRASIISLYEYDYSILRKLEEEYSEMQYQDSYFKEINNYLAPNISFNERGNMINIEMPLKLSESEKKIMLTYLWKIKVNRVFALNLYSDIEKKANIVMEKIERSQNDS